MESWQGGEPVARSWKGQRRYERGKVGPGAHLAHKLEQLRPLRQAEVAVEVAVSVEEVAVQELPKHVGVEAEAPRLEARAHLRGREAPVAVGVVQVE